MKSINKCYPLFFSVLILLISTSFKPANDSFTIAVRITSTMHAKRFETYTITGNNKHTEITWLKCDSIFSGDTYADRAYPQILKNNGSALNLPQQQQYQVWDTVDSLYNIHSRHTIKKIKIKWTAAPAYFKLLDSVIHASEPILTPKDHRSFLDGTDFSVKITSGNQLSRFYASSPEAQSHPLLYRFLNSTYRFFGRTANNY